jgi:hypothetical protein
MQRTGIMAVLLLTQGIALFGCTSAPDPNRPGFEILDKHFTVEIPSGYCMPSKAMAAGFDSLAAQNNDKVMMINLVDCAENAKYVSATHYFSIMTYSDPARMKLTKAQLFQGFVPDFEDKAFLTLLQGKGGFEQVKARLAKAPGQPLGKDGNLFPKARDARCLYAGGTYGPLPLTPETSNAVIDCQMSIEDRQVIIFHHGSGKKDLLAMVREVARLAASIRVED